MVKIHGKTRQLTMSSVLFTQPCSVSDPCDLPEKISAPKWNAEGVPPAKNFHLAMNSSVPKVRLPKIKHKVHLFSK